jgi:hypothetical protein
MPDWLAVLSAAALHKTGGVSTPVIDVLRSMALESDLPSFYRDLAILPIPPWFNPVRTHYRLTERIPV